MQVSRKDEFKTVKQFQGEVNNVLAEQIRFGLILAAILIFGFGGWLVFARIDKAAIATGEIVPGGNNRIVQHLEGGVIQEVLVKEGDVVKEGQVLIKLSKTSAQSNVDILSSDNSQATAEYSRLVAERDELDKVKYPDEWVKNPERYKQYTDAQNKIFEQHRSAYKGKVDILKERNKQLESEIKGLNAQLASAKDQLSFTSTEIVGVEKLMQNGNTTMSRLLALKSHKAEIEGSIGEAQSSIAKAQQAESENQLNIVNLKNENLNDVVEKIKDAQARMDESKDRGTSASDTLSRTEIRAPIAGIVKDMKFKTGSSSGVIPPNAEVLTIVPSQGELVAEIRINANDIDVVRKPDLKARIRVTAYNARHIPMLNGKLIYVSADSFQDPQTKQNYYKGRVTIDTSPLAAYLANNNEVRKDAYLYPGMQVEAFIVTGARSPISYITEPIRNDFSKAFREE